MGALGMTTKKATHKSALGSSGGTTKKATYHEHIRSDHSNVIMASALGAPGVSKEPRSRFSYGQLSWRVKSDLGESHPPWVFWEC